jgi:hypothetical protein
MRLLRDLEIPLCLVFGELFFRHVNLAMLGCNLNV